MATSIDYGLLATVLLDSNYENQEDLPSKLIKQVQESKPEQRLALLQILAKVLQRVKNPNAEQYLSNYVLRLVDDRRDTVGENAFALVASIVSSQPSIANDIATIVTRILEDLLVASAQATASSDDGFAVTSKEFMALYVQPSRLPKKETRPLEESALGRQKAKLHSYLEFMKVLLLRGTNWTEIGHYVSRLTALLLAALGLKDGELFKVAIANLKGLLGEIDKNNTWDIWKSAAIMVFHRLKDLLCSEDTILSKQEVYSFWLHWLGMGNCGPTTEMLKQDDYWSMLQTGLATGFTAQKKICLKILNASMRQIKGSIRTRHFIWEEKKRAQTQQAWAKYSTLLEMIAFDTSANQFRDALPEVHMLLTSPCDNYIHGTWITALLTLALTSLSTAIQNTAYNFLVSLDSGKLEFLIEGERYFVTKIFLPYALTASNFKVITGIKGEICAFGSQFSEFISRLLNLDIHYTLDLFDQLLDHLINAYDIINSGTRIYLLNGMAQGLMGKHILKVSHIEKVVRVSQIRRFSKMRSELSAAICLRLLLSADMDVVKPSELIAALAKVLDKNEFLFGLLEAEKFYPLVFPALLTATGLNIGSEEELFGWPTPLEQVALIICLGCAYSKELTPVSMKKLEISHSIPIKNSIQLYARLLCYHSSITSVLLSSTGFKTHLSGFLQRLLEATITIEKNAERTIMPLDQTLSELTFPGGEDDLRQILGGLNPSEFPEIRFLFDSSWNQSYSISDKGPVLNWLKWKADLLSICKHTGKAIAGAGSKVPLAPRDILDVLESYSQPSLIGNAYESSEILQSSARTLDSIFTLLSITISQSQHAEALGDVNRILKDINFHMRFIENDALFSVMRSLHCILDKYNLGPSIPHLANIFLQFWETTLSGRLGAETRNTFAQLLGLVFHPQIVKASVDDLGVSETLIQVAGEALKLAVVRRGIAPSLSQALRTAFISCPETFCSNLRFVDVFFDIISLTQARDIDLQLDVPLACLFDKVRLSEKKNYEIYFGAPETASRASIYDILNRLSSDSHIQSRFGKAMRSRILTHWIKVLEKRSTSQFNSEKKADHLQTLLLLERFLSPEDSEHFIRTSLDMISAEPHPRYRFMFEWMASRTILQYTERAKQIWKLLEPTEKHSNPRFHVSLVKIALITAVHISSEREKYYQKLVNTIVPLISSNKVAVRHLAISAVLPIWDDALRSNLTSITSNKLLDSFRHFILNSPYYLENEHEVSERPFDPVSNFTLLGIFQGSYLNGVDEVQAITASDWKSLPYDKKIQQNPYIPLGDCLVSANLNEATTIHYTRSESAALSLIYSSQASHLVSIPIQKKSGTFDLASTVPSFLCPSTASFSQIKQPHHHLLLLATFISNPLNLGGLSRVSEIFGVSTLYFDNPSAVLKTREFTSVSVSSETWLPIKEVKKESVIPWIREKKSEGFKVVGVEQTDRSVILGEYKDYRDDNNDDSIKGITGGMGRERTKWWEKKTLLVLGSEREGIPAEALGEMDQCVEIRQRGETRSLNVQTAAAVVLYEYWRAIEQEEK